MIKEKDIQAGVVSWLRLKGFLFAANLEGVDVNFRYASHLKRQGMLAGRPDIEIFLGGGHVLFIELKRKGNYLTKIQIETQKKLSDLGFQVHTVTAAGVVEAINKVEDIINENRC